MTEAEWLVCADPVAMLRYLKNAGAGGASVADFGQRLVSDRRLRLFACACCRAVWHLLTDERSRRAVEVAERYADGKVGHSEAADAEVKANLAARGDQHSAAWLACWAASTKKGGMLEFNFGLRLQTASRVGILPATQAALLRAVVNPWAKPLARACPECGRPLIQSAKYDNRLFCEACRVYTAVEPMPPCPWLTPQVIAVASTIYAERRFDECGVLADALEDAGCDNADLLNHLRGYSRCPKCLGTGWNRGLCNVCCGPGWPKGWQPYPKQPRTCVSWALDLILGKE